jgi:hypothetical protein
LRRDDAIEMGPGLRRDDHGWRSSGLIHPAFFAFRRKPIEGPVGRRDTPFTVESESGLERETAMNTRYQTSSNPVRAIAAAVAVATVLALFDFVAGLGDSGSEALARAQPVQQSTRIASVPSPVAQQ